MEKKRRKIMRKEFKAALDQAGVCHDLGQIIEESYWIGFIAGLARASEIERGYNLDEIEKRIKAAKKLVKEGKVAVSETDATTDTYVSQAEILERNKMLLSNLKKIRKRMIAEMEHDIF